MTFRFCPACSLFVLSCSHTKETTVALPCPQCNRSNCRCGEPKPKETTVSEPTEAETTAKRGISSLSPTLQALAKIDRILADLDPNTVDRVLSFLIGENGQRFKAPATGKVDNSRFENGQP